MSDNFVRKVNKTGKVTDEPFYTNDPLDLLGEKDNNKAYIRLEQEYHCLTDNVKSINGTMKPDKNGNVTRIVTTVNGITANDSGQLTYKQPLLIHQFDSGEAYVSIVSSVGLTNTIGKLAPTFQGLNNYPNNVSEQIKPVTVPDMSNYYQYVIPKNSDYQYLGIYETSNLASLRKMVALVVIPPKA